MAATPKYAQFRTIRATMGATGTDFRTARVLRQQSLSRSAQGRTMLAREERRRELQRLSLPTPSDKRDYGPGAPHVVVLELTFNKAVKTPRGWATLTDKRTFTLIYKNKPKPSEIRKEINKIYDDHATDNGPLGDSDIDDDWSLTKVRAIGYYVQK